MEDKTQTNDIFPNGIFFLLIAGGMALAVHQFFWNRSLWLDEAMLALNIINRDFSGLLRPLDMVQIAPIGFLQGEKVLTLLFGNSDLALRILPLIAYCLSIPLVHRVAIRLTRNKTIALMACSIVSIAPLFVRYASEVKQYSSDMFFTLAILSFVLDDNFSSLRRAVLFGILGAVALWFSNTVIIILAAAGLYLFRTEILGRKNYRILVSFTIIGGMFLTYYALFIHNHPLSGAMRDFWMTSFQPLNPFSIEFFIFPLKGMAVVFKAFFDSWITGPVMLLVAIYAAIHLVRNREYRIDFLSDSFCTALDAFSAQHKYPFPEKPSQTK
jgi:hypothetical protein